jgi:hypothetical protein
MAIPAIVGAAAVTGIANLFGQKKGSDAAKDAAKIQTDYGQKALDETKRVYDLEQAEERRQREARAGIFDRYGTDPASASALPKPYGMSDEQAATMRQGNMGNRGNAGRMMPTPEQAPTDLRTQPVNGGMGRPKVTLQAPTGEIMEVDVDAAPGLIRRGAVMVPGQGAQNAFGGAY